MIDDVVVVDGTAHVLNLSADNAINDAARLGLHHIYGLAQALSPPEFPVPPPQRFFRRWSAREVRTVLFDQSRVDAAVVLPVPLGPMFREGLGPWSDMLELARLEPDRTFLYGAVNPFEGTKAVEDMHRLVQESGVVGFKFYPFDYHDGNYRQFRLDDEQIAFPVLETARALGAPRIAIHKGLPASTMPLEFMRTFDLDRAAAAFPDVNFMVLHPGMPWIDEICWQVLRYPNLYVNIAVTLNLIRRQPRQFAEIIGKLLMFAGPDRIFYGSEVGFWHPRWALDAFWDFEIPAQLIADYGYPPLDRNAKTQILGANVLRFQGEDPEAWRRKLNPTTP